MQGGIPAGGTSAAAPSPAREAAESYQAFLAARPALARETHDSLVAAHERLRLMIRNRRLCTVMQPRFLSTSDAVSLATDAAVIAAVLERAGDAILQSDAMLAHIGASAEERDLWAIDPGYHGFTLTSRLDSFAGDDGPRFIEYNAESPAGIGIGDCLTHVFDELPGIRAWSGDRTWSHGANGRAHLLAVLQHAYGEWGGTGPPSIAIVDWPTVITGRDFELCAEYFREQGIQTVIADPREVEYRGGTVWVGDCPITLIYRRALLHELIDRADEVQPLFQAYRDGAVCMINSPRSKLLHKKTVFALLSEGALGIDLSASEQEVINRTIPWTRQMQATETRYQGASVDLYRLLRDEKDRFAVKPADEYGGKGVVLGWELDDEEWDRMLESAFEGEYIVQERVSVPNEVFPVWEDGLRMVPLWVDSNPLLFGGRMGAILTRMSGSALLNVTAGSGSSAPTFLVEEGA